MYTNFEINYKTYNLSSLFRSSERIKKIEKIYAIKKEAVRF